MEKGRRRVLVAVEPALLGEALDRLLRDVDVDDVDTVDLRGGASPSPVPGHYDAALVTIELPDDVTADVVIHLPDIYGSGGPGVVEQGGSVEEIDLGGLHDVLRELDSRCGGTSSRAAQLERD